MRRCLNVQASIVYQFHNIEILQAFGPMLIPAMLCVEPVVAASVDVAALNVLDNVAVGIFVDATEDVIIFIVVEPMSMFISMVAAGID